MTSGSVGAGVTLNRYLASGLSRLSGIWLLGKGVRFQFASVVQGS